MFIKRITLALALACLAFSLTAEAQQPQAQNGRISPEAKIGLRNRVFEIKYHEPESLINVLKLLGSIDGAMSVSSEYKTITVRDYPENIATMEEAIKRLDVPAPPAPTIEFHVHILIASNATTSSTQFPPELNDVVKQLQNTLSYKNYYVMTSAVLRTKSGSPQGISNKGVADFKLNTESAARNSPIFYEYKAQPISTSSGEGGALITQIGFFDFNMRIPVETSAGTGQIQYESVGFRTPVSVREGERVVVGTTTMQDKGLIVVLSAKIIK